jgi:hydroxypyruvate isomerase
MAKVKLAANLSLLWPELPFLDRFEAAHTAGFEAVEVLFPYDINARDIQNRLRIYGQKLVLLNAPPPNYTGGERGFAARPGGEARFQHDMRRAFRYADTLEASVLHVMSGDVTGDNPREACFETLVKNLKWASRQAPKGLTLTIEPLNPTDFPQYYLNDYTLAAKVLDAVKRPNIRLQYDSYHAQVIHGDALEIWRRYGLRAAHIQIADAPGRVAPGLGEIDFRALLKAIAQSGYDGWISAEYTPQAPQTETELDWVKKLRRIYNAAI